MQSQRQGKYRLERITSYFYLLPQNTFVWPSSFCLHIPLSHARLLALLSSAMVPLFSMVISTYLPTYLPAPNPLRQEEGRGGAWRHLCRFSNHSTGLLASSWEVFLALISKVKCNAMGHNKSSKEKSPHSVSKPLQDSCRASKCEHTPWAHSTGQSASHDFSMWSWGLNRGCFNLTLCFQPQASRQFLRQLQGVAGMWAITHKALAAAKSPSQGGLSAAASRLGSTAGVPVPLSQGKDWMAFSFKWQVVTGGIKPRGKAWQIALWLVKELILQNIVCLMQLDRTIVREAPLPFFYWGQGLILPTLEKQPATCSRNLALLPQQYGFALALIQDPVGNATL